MEGDMRFGIDFSSEGRMVGIVGKEFRFFVFL